MPVYCVGLLGSGPFYRLVADPERADAIADLAARVREALFELHVLWPQEAAVWLVMEGEGEVEPLAALLCERAGGGWEPYVRHVEEADEPPPGLEAGEQLEWVMATVRRTRAANEPGVPVCLFCQRAPVPPHGPHCDADAPAGTDPASEPDIAAPLAGRGGSEQRLPEEAEAESKYASAVVAAG